MKRLNKKQTLWLMIGSVLAFTVIGLFVIGQIVRAMVAHNAFPFQLNIATGTPAMAEAPTQATAIVQGPAPTSVIGLSEKPQGQVNIALLGVDDYGEGNFRTDVIMILSVNPQLNKMSLISFPRDLIVDRPGCGEDRINTAWNCGKFEGFQATFENNFGFKPDYYAMVNFGAFEKVVDSIDGIDLEVTQQLTDECYMTDTHICTLEPGPIHMDGNWALWYARSRKTTSDFDRNRRAQDVVQAIAKKAMGLGMLAKAPQLYSIYREYVDTNLKLTTALPLLGLLKEITNPEVTTRYAVTPEMTVDWIRADGAQVLIPNYRQIEPMLSEALHREAQKPAN